MAMAEERDCRSFDQEQPSLLGENAAADAGIDADALAEHLQRHGAGTFTSDWAALLTAIKEKAAKPTT